MIGFTSIDVKYVSIGILLPYHVLYNGIIRYFNKYIDIVLQVYELIFVPVRIKGWVGGVREILTV